MTRKVQRVRVRLDAGDVRGLAPEEIRAILRGADEMIMRGGRTLLMKLLKGSRSKDVLGKSLDQCPVHGYYKHMSNDEVMDRIDWVILNGYLAIEYDYRLPLLVYTERGWAIERETYADELFRKLDEAVNGNSFFDVSRMKDKPREMIWRVLSKIEESGDAKYIPLLEAWEQIDYKKVRQRIHGVTERLRGAVSEVSTRPVRHPSRPIERFKLNNMQ
jgi:hypothetical protein